MDLNDRRTGSSFDEALYNRVLAAGPVEMQGSSGYFSTPAATLDPHLFTGMTMHPAVRLWLLNTLYQFWTPKYVQPREWSTVWLAGSGATYQWSAGREVGNLPGDLDILVGVDFRNFFWRNPRFQGFSEIEMGGIFNDEFRGDLDLRTNNATLPLGGTYEVTFYVNPGATDIRAINPYAAYNVTSNKWTVLPIRLPTDWGQSKFSPELWAAVNQERDEAAEIMSQFRTWRARVQGSVQGTPEWLNAVAGLHRAIQRGRMLFDSIHEQRHNAFGPGGKGFLDYYNFRWQAHKADGTVAAMHTMANLDRQAHQDADTSIYGCSIDDAGHALRVAAIAAQGVG